MRNKCSDCWLLCAPRKDLYRLSTYGGESKWWPESSIFTYPWETRRWLLCAIFVSISLLPYAYFYINKGVLCWRLRIPFKLWIFPVFRELNALEDGARTSLGLEEAKVAGPLVPLPKTFHDGLKSPFAHFLLALSHWHIVTIKGNVLHTFMSAPLKAFSFRNFGNLCSDTWSKYSAIKLSPPVGCMISKVRLPCLAKHTLSSNEPAWPRK